KEEVHLTCEKGKAPRCHLRRETVKFSERARLLPPALPFLFPFPVDWDSQRSRTRRGISITVKSQSAPPLPPPPPPSSSLHPLCSPFLRSFCSTISLRCQIHLRSAVYWNLLQIDIYIYTP